MSNFLHTAISRFNNQFTPDRQSDITRSLPLGGIIKEESLTKSTEDGRVYECVILPRPDMDLIRYLQNAGVAITDYEASIYTKFSSTKDLNDITETGCYYFDLPSTEERVAVLWSDRVKSIDDDTESDDDDELNDLADSREGQKRIRVDIDDL